jgi:two-component system response regulator AtoC
VSPDALRELTAYRWPGNIRELRNVLERLVLMKTGIEPIGRDAVLQALPISQQPALPDSPDLPLDEIERRHIERVLRAAGGNKTQAAKTLRIDYKTLLTKLKKYGFGG